MDQTIAPQQIARQIIEAAMRAGCFYDREAREDFALDHLPAGLTEEQVDQVMAEVDNA